LLAKLLYFILCYILYGPLDRKGRQVHCHLIPLNTPSTRMQVILVE